MQKIQYDKRVKIAEFNVGDKVLLDMRTPIIGVSKKLIPPFVGSYRILKMCNNSTVEIQQCSSKQTQLVHVNRIKPLYESMIWKDEPGVDFLDIRVKREADQIVNDNLITLATPVSCDAIEPQPQHFSESETVPSTEQALCMILALPHPLPPVPVYNDVYSTLPQITRFVGHTCTMWREERTTYTDFWGWETTNAIGIPMEATVEDCEKMRDLRLCNTNTMDYLGDNKWSVERKPNVQGRWLLVTGDQLINRRLEEVTLETECADCTISSPIGDIPGGTNGSITHNLVTIIWKESSRELIGCKVRLVEQEIANLYMTNDGGVERIRDVDQQIDFIYNTTILGMDKEVLKIFPLKDHEEHPSKNLTKENEKVADIIRATFNSAAHTQYSADRTLDGVNGVARDLRTLQQNRELAHKNAITAAQHSGWLAASYLDLPLCSKLIATGESISVHKGFPTNVTFFTDFNSCGPQPRSGNYTIDIEGWELTPYNPCYWHKNFVNINCRAHSYKNGSWIVVIPDIIVQGNNLIDDLPYEGAKMLGLSLHPMLAAHPMSPAAAITQILAAAREEHSINVGSTFHLNSVLSSSKKKPEASFFT
uniref:Uncharacterized protein n=1 Tax=Daphnia galeata TaxID=27404 RepID=A0A8J2WKC1_9CRUS|nr:unnamed protein product [Daphnia galeata]